MENNPLLFTQNRMREPGLEFMADSLDSFATEQSLKEAPLAEVLADLIETEYIPGKERTCRTRLKASGIPQVKNLENFALDWLKGGLSEKKLKELSSLVFVQRKEILVLMDPSGLGKTHLLPAPGRKACFSGYAAYCITCMDLLEGLNRAKEQGRLKNKLKRFAKPRLSLLDEAGYENLNPEQASLFFQLINARYENGSIIMTANKSFGSWG